MSYSSELIDQARKATGLSQNALASRMGVTGPTLSQWKNGVGSPMPQERVLELCDLAGIADEAERGYWLFGVQRDAVTITSVRRAIDTALDRLRPATVVVGLLFLTVGNLAAKADSSWTAAPSSLEQSQHLQGKHSGAMPIMSSAVEWVRRTWKRIQAIWAVPRGQPAWT